MAPEQRNRFKPNRRSSARHLTRVYQSGRLCASIPRTLRRPWPQVRRGGAANTVDGNTTEIRRYVSTTVRRPQNTRNGRLCNTVREGPESCHGETIDTTRAADLITSSSNNVILSMYVYESEKRDFSR